MRADINCCNNNFVSGSKKVNVEAFVSMVKEMQEMQDFAQQLNSSIAEMDAEIYLAAVQILSAEKDINAINDVIQVRHRIRSYNNIW